MTAVEDVKSRGAIVVLVSSYVQLTKSGKNFKANCPFHQEKTPSFFVFPERGTWRCFGACASGGDIFSFLQKIDNTSFSDALRKLAKETGVSLGYRSDQSDEAEKQKVETLHLVLEAANDYFHRILMYSPLVRRHETIWQAEEFLKKPFLLSRLELLPKVGKF